MVNVMLLQNFSRINSPFYEMQCRLLCKERRPVRCATRSWRWPSPRLRSKLTLWQKGHHPLVSLYNSTGLVVVELSAVFNVGVGAVDGSFFPSNVYPFNSFAPCEEISSQVSTDGAGGAAIAMTRAV